ncbi:MAG: bifunctional heptose 7-phosphate kinase/heptose 1-phosphate adenyltransferase, partial [Candidatus Baltobacteraceae bacterium]
MMLAPPDARTLFERMRNRRILVVGDVMVDEWIWGTVTRISPEAPVPVVAVSDHSFTLGGAGNVANNLRALDAHVDLAAAVGNDAFAQHAIDLLAREQIGAGGLVRSERRPTTRKTRVVAHNQQVVRADWESVEPLDTLQRASLCAIVRGFAATADAVVLSDYAKGLFAREVVEAASVCALVIADPKPQNLALFAGVTCLGVGLLDAAYELADGAAGTIEDGVPDNRTLGTVRMAQSGV